MNPETLLLYGIMPDEFFEKLRVIVKEELKNELQKDQLLTKEGALKMAGINNCTLMRAINEGIVKPQLVKGRKMAMYLETEILKIEKKRKSS